MLGPGMNASCSSACEVSAEEAPLSRRTGSDSSCSTTKVISY